MSGALPQRFPIRFDSWYALLSTVLLLPPSNSYIEVDGKDVRVQMAWAFRSSFPRSAVSAAARTDIHPLSRGVHGLAGRWLVNGSGQGIVTIELAPTQRAYVMGFPVSLRQLMVSVSDPEVLSALLNSDRPASGAFK